MLFRSPRQNIIAPNVAINDRILPLVVIRPFIIPITPPQIKVIMVTIKGFMPIAKSLTKTKEQNANTEPTDKSNSPAIINIPAPNTIIANSDPKNNRFLILPGCIKLRSGVKNASKIIKTKNIPIVPKELILKKNPKNLLFFSPCLFNYLPPTKIKNYPIVPLTIISDRSSTLVSFFFISANFFPWDNTTILSEIVNT